MKTRICLLVILFLQLANARAQGLIPFREVDKYGWLDMKGNIIVPARFERTFPLKEGFARFSHQGYFGFVNSQGRVAIGNNYKEAFDYQDGFARVKDGPVWGFIDKMGKQVFTVKAEDVSDMFQGRAIFRRNGFCGVINKKGKEIFPPILTHADNFKNGVSRVRVGIYHGLIDRSGKFILEMKYDFVGEPLDSFIRAKTGGLWYIYSLKGRKICKSPESMVSDISEGLAVVRVLSPSKIIWKYYMDANGKVVIKNNFEWAGIFKNEVAVVLNEGLYGVINKEGRFVVEPKFEMTRGVYQDNMLGVRRNDKWGFIDTRGNEVIPFKYDDVQDFKNGFAMVSSGARRWGIIDKKGQIIVPMDYDLVVEGDYYFMAIIGYYKAFYSKAGELIWADKPDEE